MLVAGETTMVCLAPRELADIAQRARWHIVRVVATRAVGRVGDLLSVIELLVPGTAASCASPPTMTGLPPRGGVRPSGCTRRSRCGAIRPGQTRHIRSRSIPPPECPCVGRADDGATGHRGGAHRARCARRAHFWTRGSDRVPGVSTAEPRRCLPATVLRFVTAASGNDSVMGSMICCLFDATKPRLRSTNVYAGVRSSPLMYSAVTMRIDRAAQRDRCRR